MTRDGYYAKLYGMRQMTDLLPVRSNRTRSQRTTREPFR